MNTWRIGPQETFAEHHRALTIALSLAVLVLVGILVGQVLGSLAVQVVQALLGAVEAG